MESNILDETDTGDIPTQVAEQPISPECNPEQAVQLQEQPLISNHEEPIEEELIQEEPSTDEPPTKKRKTNVETTDISLYLEKAEYDATIGELHSEMALTKPRPKKIKQFLLKTFNNRRKWITESFPPVAVVLHEYPCFKEQRWVG